MPTIEEIRAFPEVETKEIAPRAIDNAYERSNEEAERLREISRLCADWREREYLRISDAGDADKHYKRLPNDWYRWLIPTHYAHISEDDDKMIAFTKTTRKGFADIQTRMKPGRYLTEYYSERFTPDEIRDLVTRITPSEIKWATTPQDIATVYENGPRSCMSGRWYDNYQAGKRELEGDDVHHNPVSVYATEDLAVAYIGTLQNPTARCVVNVKDRTWIRCYGDTRLREALEREGYTFDNNAFGGCRLRRILYKQGTRQAFIMPYLDGAGYVVDRGDFLVMVPPSQSSHESYARWQMKRSEFIEMGSTNPLTQWLPICELTGEMCANTKPVYRVVAREDNPDTSHSYPLMYGTGAVYLRRMQINAELVASRTWKHSHMNTPILIEPNHSTVRLDTGKLLFAEEAQHNAVRCWLTNRLVHRNDLREAIVSTSVDSEGNVTFNRELVLAEGTFYCQETGETWVVTEQTCMANGTVMSKYAVNSRKHVVTDAYTGLPWSRSSSVLLHDGRYARRSMFIKVGHMCDEGKRYLSYNDYLASQQQALPLAAE